MPEIDEEEIKDEKSESSLNTSIDSEGSEVAKKSGSADDSSFKTDTENSSNSSKKKKDGFAKASLKYQLLA